MKVWSVMPLGYWHELDLLEIKLAEQDSVVDRFVVCEAPWTYSGDEKPLHLDVGEDRWEPWRDKMFHVLVDDVPHASFEPFQAFGERGRWQRENWQRMALIHGMGDLALNDVVVISDLDEILSAPTIAAYIETGEQKIVHPQIPMHRHFLNLHWRDRMALSIARICRGHHVLDDPLGVEGVRRRVDMSEWVVPFWNSYNQPHYDLSAWGWHFSWMGGTRAIDDKLRKAAHPEEIDHHNSTRTAIRELVSKGLDLQGENRRLFWLPDDRLPLRAQDDRFAHLRCGPEYATIEAVPGMYWNG